MFMGVIVCVLIANAFTTYACIKYKHDSKCKGWSEKVERLMDFGLPWESLPGPIGVKYDDTLTALRIHLVVIGIRAKTLIRASNTDVILKYDDRSFNILLELFKIDKAVKPPKKNYLDRRYFEMNECPGKISLCEFELRKDQCILKIRKETPALWSSALST